MAYPTIKIDVEKVMFEKLHIGMNVAVPASVLRDLATRHSDHVLRMATLHEDLNPYFDHLLLGMRAWLLKSMHTEKKTLSVSVPATWWDHLKHDLNRNNAPWARFLVRLLVPVLSPPQYVTESEEFDAVIRVCPH